ncbi:MAG TPA: hypothetical protein VJ596_00025 [Gemmatimonadaceae bacterium]|nr:hypothetical protein [Gemmatimonadaceae bacterium]
MRNVAFVTYEKLPELAEGDRLAVDLLKRHGVRVVPAVWDANDVSWGELDAIVVRSTWDYHLKYPAFQRWIERMESLRIPLWNPPALLRWNSDKRYLRDLAARGVNVTPTVWLERGSAARLSEIFDGGWSEVVVKPTVSASAWRTWRATPASATYRQNDLRQMLAEGGVLVQQFVEQVRTQGEWSLVFLAGLYSHAAIKRPDTHDFRVQQSFGGIAEPAIAPPWLVEQAEELLSAVELPWLYARVDACVVDGRLQLMELEMLEPSLFLELDGQAPERFARAILDVLDCRGCYSESLWRPQLAPTRYIAA